MKTPAPDARLLLRAYAAGIFPMAESRDDPELVWVDPDPRAILPLDAFHIPRRLKRTLHAHAGQVVCDRAFGQVVAACAAAPERPDSWINPPLQALYGQLHEMGFAHSVEVYAPDGALAGGLYGVALGRAFFGESMFSRRRDASKIALAHLVARLAGAGYTLLDCQFMTAHLRRFGAVEIPRARYRELLRQALDAPAPRSAFGVAVTLPWGTPLSGTL